MPYDTRFGSGQHNRVGPYTDIYDHGPVIVMQDGDPRDDGTNTLFVCLDCGYTATDTRELLHPDCDREENRITQTLREHIEEDGFPDG